MTIREYDPERDLSGIQACFVELQALERALDARLPDAGPIVNAYLAGLFDRCRQFAGQLFVAEVEGRVVGFVSVLGSARSAEPEDAPAPFAYVDDLVVLPEYRADGLGRALLSHAELYAASCGSTTLRLRVKAGNRQARVFYARAGFTEYELELEKQL